MTQHSEIINEYSVHESMVYPTR